MGSDYNITYQTEVWREGRIWVAAARPLDVLSAGPTKDIARQMLAEAVRLFLSTAISDGAIDDILAECGYQQRRGRWMPPAKSLSEASIVIAA